MVDSFCVRRSESCVFLCVFAAIKAFDLFASSRLCGIIYLFLTLIRENLRQSAVGILCGLCVLGGKSVLWKWINPGDKWFCRVCINMLYYLLYGIVRICRVCYAHLLLKLVGTAHPTVIKTNL